MLQCAFWEWATNTHTHTYFVLLSLENQYLADGECTLVSDSSICGLRQISLSVAVAVAVAWVCVCIFNKNKRYAARKWLVASLCECAAATVTLFFFCFIPLHVPHFEVRSYVVCLVLISIPNSFHIQCPSVLCHLTARERVRVSKRETHSIYNLLLLNAVCIGMR